jgi:hypothetical protein
MIRAARRNLSVVTNKTAVIPGHGPVGNKSGLSEYYDMLVEIRGNVSQIKKRGASLEGTIAAKPTRAFDQKWGQFLITPTIFTTLVYSGV